MLSRQGPISLLLFRQRTNISELYSEVLDHSLIVSLTLELERPFDFPLKTYPRLRIYSDYITHYVKNIEAGEDGSPNLANNLFLEKAELVGKTFYNVYSYKSFDDTDHIKMFVNKQYGIVGFRNYDGTM